ncbi:MAG: class D sortase [Clostridiales bacterium]|nr:class D sortase [Clostridiales bacterium]
MNKNPEKRKKSKGDKILLIVAILFLIGGVALLLVDPIKNHIRNKKVDEITRQVEEQIEFEDVEMTFVVPKDGLEVNGEEYDFYGSDEDIEAMKKELEEAQEALPDYVTLTCIGIIDVESVGIHLPIWDEATQISLRYGAGHLPGSVLPGQVGNCTIMAHHMRQEGKMFNYLDRVKKGDSIKITTQGGKEFTYICDEIKVIDASELIDNAAGNITDTKQITLITCTYTEQGKKRLLVIGHMNDD